jgi:hypothetical protein
MGKFWTRAAQVFFVLTGLTMLIGCGHSVEGTYRDPSNSITAELKNGKAYIAQGGYAVEGTYTIEGNKIIAKGDFGMMIPSPLVFTINDDGTIQGPKDTFIPRLEKVK